MQKMCFFFVKRDGQAIDLRHIYQRKPTSQSADLVILSLQDLYYRTEY